MPASSTEEPTRSTLGCGWGDGQVYNTYKCVTIEESKAKDVFFGITSILILNKGTVTTKPSRERNSEIRETDFLQKISAKGARTTFSVYQDVCISVWIQPGIEELKPTYCLRSPPTLSQTGRKNHLLAYLPLLLPQHLTLPKGVNLYL